MRRLLSPEVGGHLLIGAMFVAAVVAAYAEAPRPVARNVTTVAIACLFVLGMWRLYGAQGVPVRWWGIRRLAIAAAISLGAAWAHAVFAWPLYVLGGAAAPFGLTLFFYGDIRAWSRPTRREGQ